MTTGQVRKIILDRYPELAAEPFSVFPRCRDSFVMVLCAGASEDERPGCLVVPGEITKAKDREIVAEVGEPAKLKRLKIHVLGPVSPGVALPETFVNHVRDAREGLYARPAEVRSRMDAVLASCRRFGATRSQSSGRPACS